MALADFVETVTAEDGMRVEMLPTGDMKTTSSRGTSVVIHDDVELKSALGSEAHISSTVAIIAEGKARFDLDTNAKLTGGSVRLEGSTATFEVSTGIDGNGEMVTLKGGDSALDLQKPSAKLSGNKVDITGMGQACVGAPNVKIN